MYQLDKFFAGFSGITKISLVIFVIAVAAYYFQLISVPESVQPASQSPPAQLPRKEENKSHVDMVKSLLAWGKKQGIVGPEIDVGETEMGYALIAAENVSAGTLFKVPANLLLCYQLNNDPHLTESEGWRLIREGYSYDPTFASSMLLLYEKQLGKKSKFYHYVNTLTPPENMTLPIFWTKPEEINMLEPASLLQDLIDEPNKLFHDWWIGISDMIRRFPTIFDPQVWTFQNFKWAASLAWSHSFNVYHNFQVFTCFVPIVDFMNHRSGVQTEWSYDENYNQLVITSSQNFQKGEEITISYGKMGNKELMKWFGFALVDNEFDSVEFNLPWTSEDPLYHDINKKTWMNNMFYNQFYISINNTQQIHKLLAIARMIVVTKEEWLPAFTWGDRETKKLPPFKMINEENEKRALKLIKDTAKNKLQMYSTTIEEDEELLKSGNFTKNQRHAVILRLGQKKILNYLKKLAEHLKYIEDEE